MSAGTRPTRLGSDLRALLRGGLIEEVLRPDGKVGYRATQAGYEAISAFSQEDSAKQGANTK